MGALFVSDVARQLGARPQDISGLFYRRFLSDERCPVIAGRRLIPADYVPEVRRVLVERGLLGADQVQCGPFRQSREAVLS
jgi:hypothetical protein